MLDGAFALAYAWRNLKRGGRRSLFAAFCVAVGVAAVVGMQLLALNISASVNKAPQQANGGDISIDPISNPFQRADIAAVETLKKRGVIADYTLTLNAQRNGLGVKATAADRTTLISVRGIQTSNYPLYGTFDSTTPKASVTSLLKAPTDAVITSDVFARLHLHIGDRVDLATASPEQVTIRGVVNPAGLFQSDFGIGGTVYQPIQGVWSAEPSLTGGTQGTIASRLYVRTSNAAHTNLALTDLKQALGPLYRYTTADDVAKQEATNTERLQQLLLACGLLALLIGGIGIANTMLVSVGRRTKEIAVLKALGMKSYQVIPLFLLEAVLLGIAGSAIGIIAGIGLSVVVTEIAVQLGAQVSWSLRSSPLLVGVALGVIATAVFGFLPVLRAGRTRPIGVLRDEDAPLPRIGLVLTGGVSFLLTGGMGVVAGIVLHNFRLGVGLAYGVVIGFLFFSAFFLLVVSIASRGPSFGLLGLNIALRNLTRQKRRVASTMVALCIGVLAVGTVVVLSQNVRAEFQGLFEKDWGFNVAAVGPRHQEQPMLAEVRRLPGFETVEPGLLVGGLRLATIDGKPAAPILERGAAATVNGNGNDRVRLSQTLDGRDLRTALLNLKVLAGGRVLTASDEGTSNVVIPQEFANALGLRPGSTLGYTDLGDDQIMLHVVGIVDPTSLTPSFGGGILASVSYLRHAAAHSPAIGSVLYVQFRSGMDSAAASALDRDLPQDYAFDINSLIPVVDQILERATIFPVLLAALSLFAGGVIIANTVALAMLERRREIGVMKALGAKGSTVLRLLLLENGIVGFMGGATGMIMAVIASILLDNLVINIPWIFDPWVIGGLVVMAVLLSLAASVISALPAAREKPLIVLRYE
jgi:putative ABC transport system permease protein